MALVNTTEMFKKAYEGGIIPGKMTMNGIKSFINAAKTRPFWPSPSDFAPKVR